MRIKIALLTLCLAAAVPALSQELRLSTDSKIWLEGDSTLHAYKSTATKLEFSARAAPGGAAELLMPGAVKALKLVIPADGLRSGDSRLDKNMRKALKAEQHPNIVFELGRYSVAPAQGSSHKVSAEGSLSVAGSSRPLTLELSARPQQERLRVTGSQPLKMTDYGITPPKMMMGSIKTKNEIVVRWDLLLEPGTKETK